MKPPNTQRRAFASEDHESQEPLTEQRPLRSPLFKTPPPRRNREGSVLVAVLAIILLLSFIVTRFMEEAMQDLEYRAIFNEPPNVRSFAYSMLEVTLATIHEVAVIDEGKLHAPEQGWGDPVSYAEIEIPNDWELDIQIVDESAKLPINIMDEGTLNRMLEETFEFNFGEARELSSMLLDWIDPDDQRRLNGAESDDYLSRSPPYKAANGPLRSLEELRFLEIWEDAFFDENGRPNELYQKLDSMVSVINAGAANLNSSPPEVLEILASQEGYDSERIFDGLQNLPYLTEVPSSAQGELSGTEVRLLRVTINVRRGQVPFTVSALVEPNFQKEGSSSGAKPGTASNDAPKSGIASEQDAMAYPFKILDLSEWSHGEVTAPPARYSALDIGEESDSF